MFFSLRRFSGSIMKARTTTPFFTVRSSSPSLCSSFSKLFKFKRPAPGNELADEYNVLEAGLWNSISLNKGCCKGQETISRLITYDGVKQNLRGLTLSAVVEPGTPITIDGKKVGKLTSYALGRKESEHNGLGYVKRRAASRGDQVMFGDNIVATLIDVPYLAGQSTPSKTSNN